MVQCETAKSDYHQHRPPPGAAPLSFESSTEHTEKRQNRSRAPRPRPPIKALARHSRPQLPGKKRRGCEPSRISVCAARENSTRAGVSVRPNAAAPRTTAERLCKPHSHMRSSRTPLTTMGWVVAEKRRRFGFAFAACCKCTRTEGKNRPVKNYHLLEKIPPPPDHTPPIKKLFLNWNYTGSRPPYVKPHLRNLFLSVFNSLFMKMAIHIIHLFIYQRQNDVHNMWATGKKQQQPW